MTYPLKKTLDLRSAMADALARYVAELEFRLPRSTDPLKFSAVYSTWAQFQDKGSTSGGRSPAAAVLPDRPRYEESSLTPRLIDETWSGGEVRPGTLGDGSGEGFALFTVAELTVSMLLLVRAWSVPMRQAIMSGLEDAFVSTPADPDPSSVVQYPWPMRLADEGAPPRYGLLLRMPAYYDRQVRFALQSVQIFDGEQSAMENRWLGQVELSAQAQVCVLRPLRAMRPRLSFVIDGELASRP